MMKINLAVYRRKDWNKFRRMIDDPDKMHVSWDDWHESYLKAKHTFVSHGVVVHDVVIDLHKLKLYCSSRGLKIDGRARSQYVAFIK